MAAADTPEPMPGATARAGVVEPPLTLAKLLQALRKRWILVTAVSAMATLGATFLALGLKKTYRTTGTLQIDPFPPRPLGQEVQTVVDMGAGSYWANKEYYETQHAIISSRKIAAEVVQRLGLRRDALFLADLPAGATAPPAEATVEVAADILRSRLAVKPVKDSRLVAVSYEGADPQRAQRVLSTLLDCYIEQNVDDVVRSTGSASAWLRNQTAKLKADLEKSELALHDYKKDKNILSVSIDDQSNMLREEMLHLNTALAQARARREGLKARSEELSKVDPNEPTNLPASELLSSTVLSNLRQDYVGARSEHASLLGEGLGAQHPRVLAASARVTTTREALVAEVRNIQEALASDLTAASREVAGLSGLLKAAEQKALDLNLLEIEYGRLQRSRDNNEKLYSLLVSRSKESELTGLLRFNNIRVLEAPTVPLRPVRPRVPLIVAMGLFAGLFLGGLLAVAKDQLDQTTKAPEDLERELGLAPLGVLPVVGKTAGRRYGRSRRRQKKRPSAVVAELAAHHDSRGPVAEAARSIRTNILFMAPDRPFRRLLVTSAGTEEGKTTVACAVAIALAQADRRVLIIEGDLRRPRLAQLFGVTSQVSLPSAILDSSVLDGRDLTTGIANLDVLPGGAQVPNPAELLQSDSFSALLEKLSQRYDCIVFDSPPVLAVTDPLVLAARVDATLFVVRAGVTSYVSARRAIRALVDVGGRVIGAVLNALDPSRTESYHYYYYYQGSADTQDSAR